MPKMKSRVPRRSPAPCPDRILEAPPRCGRAGLLATTADRWASGPRYNCTRVVRISNFMFGFGIPLEIGFLVESVTESARYSEPKVGNKFRFGIPFDFVGADKFESRGGRAGSLAVELLPRLQFGFLVGPTSAGIAVI